MARLTEVPSETSTAKETALDVAGSRTASTPSATLESQLHQRRSSPSNRPTGKAPVSPSPTSPLSPSSVQPWSWLMLQAVLMTLLLLLIFSILQGAVYAQFQQKSLSMSWEDPFVETLLKRLLSMSPAVFVLVAVSLVYGERQWMQWALFGLSVVAGWMNLERMTRQPPLWKEVQKTPALGAVWAFTLIQLKLPAAVTALLITLFLHVCSRSIQLYFP